MRVEGDVLRDAKEVLQVAAIKRSILRSAVAKSRRDRQGVATAACAGGTI
ncbi:MAG: hypothetical protein KF688_06960 [Pirellulales bacterium]|nr:hypothetical protein [Pirellulales bacterium]